MHMCEIAWHSLDGVRREGVNLLKGSQVWKFTARWKLHSGQHQRTWEGPSEGRRTMGSMPTQDTKLPGRLYSILQCWLQRQALYLAAAWEWE